MRLKCFRALTRLMALGLVLAGLPGCGVNKIPSLDEQVKAAWSEVLNQYQRRADLPEPRGDGQGLCASGAERADPGDRSARACDPDAASGRHPLKEPFTPAEHNHIDAAIAEIGRSTAANLCVVVTRASDRYSLYPLAWAAIGAIALGA